MDVNSVMTRLARMMQATQATECDCGTVFEVMEEVVEAMQNGVDLSVAMPEINQHLEMCPCCYYEVAALKRILEAGELA